MYNYLEELNKDEYLAKGEKMEAISQFLVKQGYNLEEQEEMLQQIRVELEE